MLLTPPDERRTRLATGKPSRPVEPTAWNEDATNALSRALLQAALDPTVAIDALGTVLIASDSVEHVFGWRPDELVGRNVKELMPKPHRELHDDYLANYRRTGVTHILGRRREFEVQHRQGHTVACELSVARAEMPGGGEVFIGSFRDITARRRAERELVESETRFHAIFDRSYEYMGLLRPDGTLLEVNQAALDVIGAEREAVVGRKFWDTPWWSTTDDARQSLERAIAKSARGEFVRFETTFRGRGDDVLAIDFSISPVRDASGQVVLLIPEGRNITELKRAQRAETSMLRALATIGESAAMLAHEIKNPITAVNVALRAVAHQLGEDHRVVLDDLVTRMQRLEALMRRTLTFTRPLELRVSVVEPRALFDQVLRQLAPEIAKRGTRVTCDLGKDAPAVEGDRQLLEEVLTNLVTNSLEALSSGGSIVLSAARRRREVELAVDDDGPGIPPSLSAKLFNPFTTSKPQGTGLGLAFCRKVIEEHGGTIEAIRSPRGGARFAIRLPALP